MAQQDGEDGPALIGGCTGLVEVRKSEVAGFYAAYGQVTFIGLVFLLGLVLGYMLALYS